MRSRVGVSTTANAERRHSRARHGVSEGRFTELIGATADTADIAALLREHFKSALQKIGRNKCARVDFGDIRFVGKAEREIQRCRQRAPFSVSVNHNARVCSRSRFEP